MRNPSVRILRQLFYSRSVKRDKLLDLHVLSSQFVINLPLSTSFVNQRSVSLAPDAAPQFLYKLIAWPVYS